MSATQVLASWNDGGTKEAILAFVRSITTPGPDFVPEADRIATFDNDGTLWCEKPTYVQADFILRKWAAMVKADPTLAGHQPFKAVAAADRAWLGSVLEHVPAVIRGVSEAFGGITTEAFSREVGDFFRCRWPAGWAPTPGSRRPLRPSQVSVATTA